MLAIAACIEIEGGTDPLPTTPVETTALVITAAPTPTPLAVIYNIPN